MKNKILILIGITFLVLSIINIHAEASYCCERLNNGAWCQNVPVENAGECNEAYRKVPTSCEATSYCKLGCCYDSQEGTCMESTPQRVCEETGGVWAEDSSSCDIPQCSLGCCLIGDQAAFVSQTRCKRLSSLYGLEINFRTDIENEIMCIASATSEIKGACVFEKEYEKTCLMTTKRECSTMETEESQSENESLVGFHEGYLCSDETLGTNCGPSEKTTCVDGKDGVYFVDTCGNIANIYDATKIKDKTYWSKIIDVSTSCNPTKSNAESASCGNCDYFLGSTCKDYIRGENKKPTYGDKICKDLSCEYLGKVYQHGETWCANSQGITETLPGSRYFRLVCYNGEVTIEPCADYRQEICIQSDISGFKTAACIANMWQDCSAQDNQQDCENTDRRDCEWVGNVQGQTMKCIPKYSPGFDFWNTEGDTEEICSSASTECTVTYEKKLTGDKECVENCECLRASWTNMMNKICVGLGDCGSQTNYIGIKGYHDEKAIYSGSNSSSD